MQPVLYIDVLIFMNTVITFFLLMSTGELTHLHPTAGRITVASLVGGVYALIILSPAMNVFLMLLTKAVMAVTLIGIAFELHKIRNYFYALSVFLLMSFLYAGVIYALQYTFSAEFIRVNNGIAYYNLPSTVIISICLVISLIVKGINRGFFGKNEKNNIYRTEIYYKDNMIVTDALFDTGNALKDVYTDAPVIVLCKTEAEHLIGTNTDFSVMSDTFPENPPLRLIPVNSIAGQSVLPAFTVQKAIIRSDGSFRLIKNPTIAVTEDALGREKYRALINCDSV